MTDRLEDATPTTVVKRGGSIQPQALGPQKRSNVGSSAASSSQGQNKIFDPETAPTIIDRPKHAASRISAEAKKRPTRRGRGPEKAQGGVQTTPNAGPIDAPTISATRTRQTTSQRSSSSSQQQPGGAALIVPMLPCRDFREIEQERREEIEAVRSLARTQSNLARRTALDNSLDEQRRGPEETPRERELERRRQIPAVRDEKDDARVPILRLRHRAYHAHVVDTETQLRRVPLHLLRMLIRETLRMSESLVRPLEISPGENGSTLYTL
jgi:hypothetical protein